MSYIALLNRLNRQDIPLAGGKGANLGELLHAGLPVPPGFCILTPAYRQFVENSQLNDLIQVHCAAVDLSQPDTLETASLAIRAGFSAAPIPAELNAEICAAYQSLCADGSPLPVAVRSSATAEDLPDFSFAGQQDTFLNIMDKPALLKAVVDCWSSLWTGRAIGYRMRNGITHSDVTLAVVVQIMVESESSGVLFTANPLTGKRDETVIDATFGLGEALVSGKVEPDQYIIRAGKIQSRHLGAKALSIHGMAGGGTRMVSESMADRPALKDEDILRLTHLGAKAAAHFGSPQDVEWALADGKLYLVQSRPITSLFPLPPSRRGPDDLLVLFNFGVIQGLLGPITPLGRDIFHYLLVSITRTFGSNSTIESEKVIYETAERLFIDLNGIIRDPVGHKIIRFALPAVEPASGEAITPYLNDPRLAVQQEPFRIGSLLRLFRVLGPRVLDVILNFLSPDSRRKWIFTRVDQILASFKADRDKMAATPEGVPFFLEHVVTTMPKRMFLWLVFVVVSGQVAFQGLRRRVADLPDGELLALQVTRGLAHNVTTEMDLALWETARAIRRDPEMAAWFQSHTAEELADAWLKRNWPPHSPESGALGAVDVFMTSYGMRGIGEIDLGTRRWREEPAAVMRSLLSYLQIDQPDAAPDVVFARGAREAGLAITRLEELARSTRGGFFKSRQIRFLASRTRALTGLRELPKFTIIRIFGELRDALLFAGKRWTKAGWIKEPEDVFFLRINELKILARGEQPAESTWEKIILQRRAAREHEANRRQVPRIIFGDGTTIYEGIGGTHAANAKILPGSPVSPGQVEGVVHVVLNPFGTQLAPGEILVCPGTDPAWTPLFLAAGGLVMETGGLMTHGAVVAREYGIPAVVGVGGATERLRSGMRIRVDGTTGMVTILEE